MLDKARPYPVTMLGQSYVVWWDAGAAQWRLAQDRCPHRLAPLSEGRIEPDGSLSCSYQ
jgi:pheophorbide a oxygenase